jgi:WD40 repeat protein
VGETTSGRIFISYRREDTSATAGRLYDRLVARFGADSVFMDVDSIAPGHDFAEAIETAVGSCQVVLAVIGTHWLDAADERGWRRLDDPDDFVALEIKAGLDRDIPVIPVLVGGTSGPRRDDLPATLSPLARRQSLRLDHDSFSTDFTRLMAALERTFARAGPPPPPAEALDGDIPPPSRLAGTLEGGNSFWSVAFSSDMRLIAGANTKGTFLWESRSHGHLRTLGGQPGAVVTAVVFGPGTDRLATASWDKTVRLWDPTTGDQLHVLSGHTNWVQAVAFSPDGRVLASGSSDTTARLWDPTSGAQLRVLDGHRKAVTGVAFSPDGRLLATASVDKTVRLWDAATGRPVHTLVGHTQSVSAVAFLPDGDRLVTGSRDETVRVWDPTTATGHVLLRGAGMITSLTVRPDGGVLAAGCADKTVRLWDPTTGRPLGNLKGHRGVVLLRSVSGVAFSPDGRTLASAGDDGTVRLWA